MANVKNPWLIVGSRGAGKTGALVEWVAHRASIGRAQRGIFVGATFERLRMSVVEGPEGFLRNPLSAVYAPKYYASKRQVVLTLPSGATANVRLFAAERPGELAGMQCETLACDDIDDWTDNDAWERARLTLALGDDPQITATSKSRPAPMTALASFAAHSTAVITEMVRPLRYAEARGA